MKKKSTAKKVILSILIVAVVLGLSYLAHYLMKYTFNKEYKKYLLSTEYAKGSEFKGKKDASMPDSMAKEYVLAEESDALKLYINEATAEVAVLEKASGKVTFSNPQNVKATDYRSLNYKNEMASQLIVYYYNKKGDTLKNKMNTYEHCVNLKSEDEDAAKGPQFKLEKIDNGIRVIYTIGSQDNANGIVPDMMSEATLNELLDKLKSVDEAEGTKHANAVKNFYFKSKTKDGYYEKSQGATKRKIQMIQDDLKAGGWTEADFTREMDEAGCEYTLPISFEVPLDYTLEGDKLVANICTDHIVENGGASIITMDVLPYFGAECYASDGDKYVVEFADITFDASAKKSVNEIISANANDEVIEVTFANGFAGEVSGYESYEIFEAPEVVAPAPAEKEETAEEGGEENGESAENAEETTEETTEEVEEPESTPVPEQTELTEKPSIDGVDIIDSWSSVEGDKVLELKPNTNYNIVATINKGPETVYKVYSVSTTKEKILADGYFLVPNGSGSLIKLNSSQCDGYADYTERFYGSDDIMFDSEQRVQETVNTKLPVFGLSSNASNMFVMITRGESLGELHVQTANNVTCQQGTALTNFNTAYCKYYLRAENLVEMSAADKFTVWNEKIFDTQITQKYCFLSDKYSGYSGMATYYREYLESNEQLANAIDKKEAISLYLDLVGSIKGDTTLLGVNYESVIPVTTFKQATAIVNSFYDNKINNLVVNYQGWMNDGYYHETADDIKVVSKLGGKKGYNNFVKYVSDKGGKVYGDMAIVKVSFAAEEFQYNQEASRTYGKGLVAAYGKTGPTTYSNAYGFGYRANLYDIVSPKFLMGYVEDSLDEMKKFENSGISYRDLGSTLYGDFKKTNIINREHSKEVIMAALELAGKSGKDLLINEPNSYALKYATDIINAPIGDNNYIYVDCEVPFYEMVIHGYINYSGNAINLSADTTTVDNILECIEYGAAPHFTLSYEPASVMKYTALNNLYATNYTNWVDEATVIYNEVNEVLSKVKAAKIVKHEILDDNNTVKRITYDNGVVIYVNYSTSSFKLDDGRTIAAKSYDYENK